MPPKTFQGILLAGLTLLACRCATAEVLDQVKNVGGVSVAVSQS